MADGVPKMVLAPYSAAASASAAALAAPGTGAAGSRFGTGGMLTKLKAGQLATAAGTAVVITLSDNIEVIEQTLAGALSPNSSGQLGCPQLFASRQVGTTLLPAERAVTTGRKRWILSLAPQGILALDEGAADAVLAKKSLFPPGMKRVEGRFDSMDAVSLVRESTGAEIARALVNYSADDCRKLLGKRSRDAPDILGFIGPETAAERDNIVLLG
jgi:glutamate 5-kinase